jgi:hypothetical protein
MISRSTTIVGNVALQQATRVATTHQPRQPAHPTDTQRNIAIVNEQLLLLLLLLHC